LLFRNCLLFFSFLVLPLFVGGQELPDFSKIDRHARRTPAEVEEDIRKLTAYLIEPAQDETEKARALFSWITQRIQYDEEASGPGQDRINQNLGDILRRKKAICQGYAELFAAMGRRAGLEVEVIDGYSKGTVTASPRLNKPDHSWNAVRIEGEWHLLDATWGASLLQDGNAFASGGRNSYFLTPPLTFLQDHLPAMPMWQLIDCPIEAEAFRIGEIPTAAPDTVCFAYRDSIQAWRELPPTLRRLATARASFRYHPSPANRHELGQSYMDWAGRLSDRTDAFLDDTEGLIRLQDSILQACGQGTYFAEKLYNWQKELYASTLINQAVAKYNQAVSRAAEWSVALSQARAHLEKAELLLLELPPDSLYREATLPRCRSYLDVVREAIGD
jgi:hypothetical protein